MREVNGMPRWFWLLPLVAMASWWPIGAYWASDDFIAVQYSQDLGRAASDLIGRQYGATDVWAFYRPLITLSFWFDQTVAGVGPPFGHCSNVVAHGLSTLLVALIWRRFLADGQAFGAALLWMMMAGHIGSIAWVVGRVDSHTTVWCLLAIWLCLRANEQRATGAGGRRWPIVTATMLALMSKELAFVVPPVITWLSLAQSPAVGLGAKLRDAWRATWPVWALLALYLPFRLLVLGTFGGYEASNYDGQAALMGLGTIVLDLLVPLRWIGMPNTGAAATSWSFLIGAAMPVAIALLIVLVRRPRLVLMALVAFGIALVPMATFLSSCETPHNLRYYYLPTIALVGLLASAGRWLVLAVALSWLWPLVAVRHEQYTADRQSAAMHAALLREAPTVPEGPMFVAGLPHANSTGTAVQLHFGIDRMLQPPFYQPGVTLLALRPLLQHPSAFRLVARGEPPFSLPAGSTWWFPNATALGRAPTAPPLPELTIAGDDEGLLDLSTERLMPLIDQYQEIIATGRSSFGLTMPGVQQPHLRVTLLTANGYLSCICANHARSGETGGRFDVVRFLAENGAHPWQVGRISPEHTIGDALVVPTSIDLVTEFPTLIEAGVFDLGTLRFTTTHRARRLLRFRFDRSYPSWVRKAQGKN